MRRTTYALIAALAAPACALAQPKAPQVTITVSSSTGGLYDVTARLFARHLGRFLPGEPQIIVQNMPGAGGMTAINHLANLAPNDGSVLGVITATTVQMAHFGDSAARFDPRKLAWIGGRARETAVCGFWHEAKAASFADLRAGETLVAASGPGARSWTHPAMYNALLGTKLRMINGYPGGSEMSLAIERREADGVCGWSWGSVKSRTANWLREGKVKILTQAAMKPAPDLPNVPFALDLAANAGDRAVMEALLIDTELAWPLVGPPGMPAAKVAQLREAFAAMTKDGDFLKEAEQRQVDVDPVRGEEMQTILARLYEMPPALVARAKAIFK